MDRSNHARLKDSSAPGFEQGGDFCLNTAGPRALPTLFNCFPLKALFAVWPNIRLIYWNYLIGSAMLERKSASGWQFGTACAITIFVVSVLT
jgi:hypothetical protein